MLIKKKCLYIFLVMSLSCIIPCIASDQKPEKCRIVIPIGTQVGGTFVQQSISQIKIDPTCTLQELQAWLNSKKGAGILYYGGMPVKVKHLDTENIKVSFMPSPDGNSYIPIIPTYATVKLNYLLQPMFKNFSVNLQFRFILNNNAE